MTTLHEIDVRCAVCGDDEDAATTEIARYIGTLARAEDDAAHSCGEAFATDS
ncbi:MAG: hypothetical protein OEV72_13150 [Thermoleophilia bacterium]|nr:hypothetical protein [Thermoleophilia bacterium]